MNLNNPGVGGSGGGGDVGTMDHTIFNGSPVVQPQPQQPSNSRAIRGNAYVNITEEPAGKALRFRYECEGRSAGSIPGVYSTPENKTFPAIEICNYKGRAVVVVSCVTKDPPYRAHPHNLVGKEGCKKGVCTIEINSDTMKAVFSNLGIQCVKKKDIESALKAREEIRVDPYKMGFSHRFQPSSIDLNSVRLCFQVFLEKERGRFTVPLAPVVSDPIYDKKAMSDLVICTLCSCTSTVAGGKEIILLCEKVAKEDIKVRFFEERDGKLFWEDFGDFQHTDVHKQTAIKFKTPRYATLDVDQQIKVFIQLLRPSDSATSEPLPFDYLPLDSDPEGLKRKRQKTGGDPNAHLIRYQHKHQNEHLDGRTQHPMGFLNIAQNPVIKTERDTSPLPYNMYGQYRAQDQSPSPQPLSPYNNTNTPSPYSMMGGGATPNTNLMSPSHQYGGPGAGAISPNMGIQDFGAYHQQQQPLQQQPLQQQTLQQQPQHQQMQYNAQQGLGSHFTPLPMQQQWESDIKYPIQMTNNLTSNNFNNPSRNQQNFQFSSTSNNMVLNNMQTNNYNPFLTNTQNQQTMVAGAPGAPPASEVNNMNIGNEGINFAQNSFNSITDNIPLNSGFSVNLADLNSDHLIQVNSKELSGLSISG